MKKNNERYETVVMLLFLLIAFSGNFCFSQSALWFVDRERIEANMLSGERADYSAVSPIALAPLRNEIAAEADRQEELLLQNRTPIAQEMDITILPTIVPMPHPIASPVLTSVSPTVFVTPLPSPPRLNVVPTPVDIVFTPTAAAPTPTAMIRRLATVSLTTTAISLQIVSSDAPFDSYIELYVQSTQIGLWAIIQRQDSTGNWHDVEGWQGTLDQDRKKMWWVDKTNFATGPFRCVIYQDQGGRLLATSKPFYLPNSIGKIVHIELLLEP